MTVIKVVNSNKYPEFIFPRHRDLLFTIVSDNSLKKKIFYYTTLEVYVKNKIGG